MKIVGDNLNIKKNYNYHIKNSVCHRNNRFNCKLCKMYYKNKYGLKIHLINKHSIHENEYENYILKNKKYKSDIECTFCGNKFTCNSSLNRHVLENCKILLTKKSIGVNLIM